MLIFAKISQNSLGDNDINILYIVRYTETRTYGEHPIEHTTKLILVGHHDYISRYEAVAQHRLFLQINYTQQR